MVSYGFGKTVGYGYDEALVRTTEALKDQGFGVLTEIDVRETLRKKLDKDFPRYKILGACNPPFAFQALSMEPEIGLLLPCNVVVREAADGTVRVECMDPIAVLQLVKRPEVEAIARQVRERLDRMLEAL
jgi:uncharacterized protein (DUF302 family)